MSESYDLVVIGS
ncbi:unnamed protein product, partial [Fusarium fujikuroi]